MSSPGGEPFLSADLAAFVGSGVAVMVATRDGELTPELTRGWGPSVSPDGRTLTLCLDAYQGSRIRENLEDNGAVAATFVLATTYRSLQVKGTVVDIREPAPEQLARVERHFEAFARESEQVGLPRLATERLLGPDLAAVTFGVRELYDQTPGPGAGGPA